LNYVSARLEEIPTDREISHQSSPSTTPSINEEEDYRRDLEEQTDYSNKLVDAGGRPSHPVSLGRDILRNPGQYHEVLSYWQLVNCDAEGKTWEVFGSQWREWNEFLNYRRSATKHACFPTYCQRLRDRLVKHEFEGSFELCEELGQQNKLATWIEFLNYKYELYDKTAGIMSHYQPRRDAAWSKLVDSKVLQPSEIGEALDGWFLRQLEKNEIEARNDVESAEKDLANCTKLCGHTSQMEQKLAAARSKVSTATQSHKLANKRRDLIGSFMKQTKSYRIAKNDVARQSILLQWILEQIPLIESELSTANGANYGANAENGRRRGRKRSQAEDVDEELAEHVSKRQRQDDAGGAHPSSISEQPNSGRQGCKRQAKDVDEEPERASKRQRQDAAGGELPGSMTKQPNSYILPSKPTRLLRASKAASIKPDPEKSRVVPDEGMRLRIVIQRLRRGFRQRRPQRMVDCNEKPPSRQNGENQILVEGQTRTSGKGRFLSKQPRHRVSRPPKTNANSAKPAALLDDNARIRKRKERNKSSMDCAPNPPRRSSRLADRLLR
jgi:hypothetical protein